MINNINLTKILFLDIETVPITDNYDNLSDDFKKFWDKKSSYFTDENQTPKDVFNKAGIYSEFGKIICISVGYISDDKTNTFRVKSFAGDDEQKIINDFFNLLNKSYNKRQNYLCAHNGIEFDFPFIARRAVINNIKLPDMLNISATKRWENKHLIDTMEMWKFGDYKHYTSLNLLVKLFNIPTPKDDIDGSQVADVYYKENNLQRIVKYCEKDVIAVARLYLRLKNKETIIDDNIIFL